MGSTVSTHVLDASLGRPAHGVTLRLERLADVLGSDGSREATTVASGRTDADGRVPALADALAAGTYRLTFDVADYFRALAVPSFYPEVAVTFTVADPPQHYHVPLLLSPFAYSTYRGS